eukprot:TRINITY_DN6765_c0_g1_i2.p1 TRINITY_DN6765_c0_g1~~TRINITY_DN6765_c0_g1_i2.p1  ORF type:complete len:232 (+),score=45.36 TRINITY_DN6765_c0_g1_i2:48-743(+)
MSELFLRYERRTGGGGSGDGDNDVNTSSDGGDGADDTSSDAGSSNWLGVLALAGVAFLVMFLYYGIKNGTFKKWCNRSNTQAARAVRMNIRNARAARPTAAPLTHSPHAIQVQNVDCVYYPKAPAQPKPLDIAATSSPVVPPPSAINPNDPTQMAQMAQLMQVAQNMDPAQMAALTNMVKAAQAGTGEVSSPSTAPGTGHSVTSNSTAPSSCERPPPSYSQVTDNKQALSA